FPTLALSVTINLPDSQSPYLDSHAPHGATMTLPELVALIESGQRCYLNQANLDTFPNLEDELDLSRLTVPPVYALNLWLGGRTRSGLHFDSADNFVIQIYGTKTAVLIAPHYARSLSLVPDNHSKSSLRPSQIEGRDNGALVRVPRWFVTIHPGDALFIP